MNVAAIVVAAGQGSRFGGAKQFALIDGVTAAARSVQAARSVASLVVLVVSEEYSGSGEGADLFIDGGPTRASSVREGLKRCRDADIVVVHDAARPFASEALFRAVVDGVISGADAVIPGLKIADTVKRVATRRGATVVKETLSRDELISVQTPQAFRREVLVRAHKNRRNATDDAALVEAIGATVVVVDGERQNFKITYPEDLQLFQDRIGDHP